MKKKAVVVVDMQVDFVTGSLGTAAAQAIVPLMVKYLRDRHATGEYDFYCTHDTHGQNYMETQEGRRLPVPHTILGTEGWELIPELKEFEPTMTNFNKPTFGSYEMMVAMREAGYEEVEFVGVCTGICDISNAVMTKAALPEARIVIYENLCACVNETTHNTALDAMRTLQMDIETYTA